MSRRVVFAVTAVLVVCLVAVGITALDRAGTAPPEAYAHRMNAAGPDAGEGAMVRREEGKVGVGRKGAKLEIKKLDPDRMIAHGAGGLGGRGSGAMTNDDVKKVLDGSGLSPEMKRGIGGLIRGQDFGAARPEPARTIYVSNDDSMSLASAQYALYALQSGHDLDPKEIRPHEILNYFTFKTAPPEPGELFDVFASAERDGDHLHVALAVSGATPARLPLDLTLLVDISGSMDEEGKLERTKRALLLLTEQLRPGDRVDLVAFNNFVHVPLFDWVLGAQGRGLLRQAIGALATEGSTNLDLGLREAYRVAQMHERTRARNRRILVITDAIVNTGDVNPETVTNIARAYEESDIRLTGVGVGSNFNAHVLDRLTEKGKGAYVFLGSDAVVERLFGPVGFASLTQTIAHDVRFALKLPPSLSMEQFFGEEASTDPTEVQPVHFSAGSRQLLLQDLVLHGGVLDPEDSIELEIQYRDVRTDEEQIRRFRSTVGRMIETDPHNVRKGRALMAWADYLMADAVQRQGACESALGDFVEQAEPVARDEEIAFVRELSEARCAASPEPRFVRR